MTPFGQKLRAIRAERKLALKDMAAGLQVSPAYLSAMEHGRRGKPSRRFVHRVCQFLGIIWDDAEELQRLADLSHPRVVVTPPASARGRPCWPISSPSASRPWTRPLSTGCWT